jgi:TetR/AcrR family transcriptional regulator, cholesterol catabolism regulator
VATGNRTYDPEQTRQALIDAAVRLFGERGFHGTSVQELVDAAGVTKGAFYHHFGSKEEALHEIHDAFIDAHIARQRVILERYASAHEQLYHLMLTAVRVIATYRPHVEVFFHERNILTGEAYDRVRAKRDEAMGAYRTVLQRGVDTGEFREDIAPSIAAFGIVGMVDWTYMWLKPDGARTPDEIGHEFAVLALRGVSAKPARVKRLAEQPAGAPA